jgi:hypothetical protein
MSLSTGWAASRLSILSSSKLFANWLHFYTLLSFSFSLKNAKQYASMNRLKNNEMNAWQITDQEIGFCSTFGEEGPHPLPSGRHDICHDFCFNHSLAFLYSFTFSCIFQKHIYVLVFLIFIFILWILSCIYLNIWDSFLSTLLSFTLFVF